MSTLESIELTPTSVTIYDDSYAHFMATGHFSDGSSRALHSYEVEFISGDESVVTVSNSRVLWGRAFAVTPGATTILARSVDDHSISDTSTITIEDHPAPEWTQPTSRFSLGFGTETLDPYPTWTAIDAHPNLVTSYTIDRGRQYELDQTDAGRATVEIMDPDGILDPTNPDGPYHGQLRPLLPASLARHDPVDDTWSERFRGYVEDFAYELDPSQRVGKLTLSLVDLFDILGGTEMHPGQFGNGYHAGQVNYDTMNQTPDERIAQVLIDTGIPRRSWVTLPGAVWLQKTTYGSGSTPLTAIQEAADGEFPNVANVFCDRHGRVCFHGRKARFHPATVAADAGVDYWDYHHWKAGDGAAVNASPSDTAQARAMSFQRGVSKIINTASATQNGAADGAEDARRVIDTPSINTYGMRSWSNNNLLTKKGDLDGAGSTGAQETYRFARFYVENYKHPFDRIESLQFRSLHPDDSRAAANWNLLDLIDIGDTIDVTVATAGGGGFDSETYFVEGVHEDVRPLAPDYDDVTLTLDLSPKGIYTYNPWADPPPDVPDTGDKNDHPKSKTKSPAPNFHAPDHEWPGVDPIGTHYENVGDPTGGGAVDLTGYLHYGVNPGDVVGTPGETLEIVAVTTSISGAAGDASIVLEEGDGGTDPGSVTIRELAVLGETFGVNVTGNIGLAGSGALNISTPAGLIVHSGGVVKLYSLPTLADALATGESALVCVDGSGFLRITP